MLSMKAGIDGERFAVWERQVNPEEVGGVDKEAGG
jgi:hypothetical protein